VARSRVRQRESDRVAVSVGWKIDHKARGDQPEFIAHVLGRENT